jgi:hypothetical protein
VYMDCVQITRLISKSPILKNRFLGCFALDNVPYLRANQFQLINTDIAGDPGTHWLLLARFTDGTTVFYDSFGRSLKNSFRTLFETVIVPYYYHDQPQKKKKKKNIPSGHNHLRCYDFDLSYDCDDGDGVGLVKQFFPSESFKQSGNTTLCGLYCIFLVHHLFSNDGGGAPQSTPPRVINANENTVLQFINSHFGENFPRIIKYY